MALAPARSIELIVAVPAAERRVNYFHVRVDQFFRVLDVKGFPERLNVATVYS